METLRKTSHNNCSTNRAQKILDLVSSDGSMTLDYQDTRDFIVSPTFGKFELKTARNHFLNPETRYLSGAILENRKVVTGNLQHFTIVYLQ